MPQAIQYNPGIIPRNRISIETAFHAACKLYRHWFTTEISSSRLSHEANISAWLNIVEKKPGKSINLTKETIGTEPAIRMARALQFATFGSTSERSFARAFLRKMLIDGLRNENFGLIASAVHGYVRLDYRRGLRACYRILSLESRNTARSNQLRSDARLICSYLRRNHRHSITLAHPRLRADSSHQGAHLAP